MNDFFIWFSLGYGHIIEPGALDHILFLTVLASSYPITEWKKTVWLLLGFTLGHGLSMLLSVLANLSLPSAVIEIAIALSIVIAVVIAWKNNNKKQLYSALLLNVCFGCIHGLGFSMALRELLSTGGQLLLPLLYFNLGLEIGQLIIVSLVLLFSLFLTSYVKLSQKTYKYTVLCISGLIATSIVAQRCWQLL